MRIPRLLSAARRLVVPGLVIGLAVALAPTAQAAAPAVAATGALSTAAVTSPAVASPAAATKTKPTLTVTATKVDFAHRATITVAVKGAGATPTGKITVSRSDLSYGSRTLAGGRASVLLPKLGVGTTSFRVTYAGDSRFTSATATIPVVVTKAKTTVSVTASRVDFAHQATISVVVKAPGATPAGKVTVTRSGKSYGSPTLVGGKASVKLPKLSLGSYAFHVAYSGGAHFLATSVNVTVTVIRAKPAVSVTTTRVDSAHQAKVSVVVKGAGVTPTGTVKVSRSGTSYGSRTLAGGKASVTVPKLRGGNYPITVSYSGNGRYLPSSASALLTVAFRGAHSFGNGMHRVDGDIVPGLYRAKVPAGDLCYWERLKDASGDFDSIIANQITTGYALIQVAPTDRYVNSDDCGTWHLVSETAAWSLGGRIPGSGMFVVGKDVAPGRYHQTRAGCYWERDRAASGLFKDIITNDYTSGGSYVTIAPTDKVFVTDDCSTWTRVG